MKNASPLSITLNGLGFWIFVAVLPGFGSANPLTEPIDFDRDIRPILQTHCYACHAASKQKSNLRLDIKSEAFKGGDNYGPSLIANNSSDSPLLQLVTSHDPDEQMPPEGERLSPAQIATLKQWIDEGANWPDGVDLAKLEDRRDHWSFKPIQKPQPPIVQDQTWPRSDLDRFILQSLEHVHLRPALGATRVAWLRRVSFDLIGLPPTPEQVENFVDDQRQDAYEQVVDDLLRSQRYGERWAQHWLDVVRYADTHGFEVNTERPNAWPYRDYVIQAFNSDTPYDQFIRQQIAGDMLGHDAATGFLITASVLLPGQIGQDEPSKRLARQDSLDEIVVNIGQTFLGLSIGCARCHDHKFDPISAQEYYSMQAFVAGVEYDDRELRTPEADRERADAEALKTQLKEIDQALARYEPIAQPKPSERANQSERAGGREPTDAKPNEVQPARSVINARFNSDRFQPMKTTRLRFTINATNTIEPCIDELEIYDTSAVNIALASFGTKVRSSGDNIAPDRHELKHINDGQYGNSRSWMSSEVGKGWVEFEFAAEQTIQRVVWGRDREGKFGDRLATDYHIEVADSSGQWQLVADSTDRHPFGSPDQRKGAAAISLVGLSADEANQARDLLAQKQKLEARIAAATNAQLAFAGKFRKPDSIHLLNRGDPEQPQAEVAPAVPKVLGELNLANDSAESDRRLALANWLVNPANPLTARVIVNRIWQGHFGSGIVETASDFGRTGTRPSHPELLDWLAIEFMRSGWSIKQLHRTIVLSSTYRQSIQNNSDAAAKDVDCRLLWRFPPRRLEAETIRDSMLAVSGRLNLTMFGRGYDLFDKRGGLSGFEPIESFKTDGLRRMIYAHKVRREREAIFGAFDCPDAGQSTSRRRESTTPIQALNLFNSRFSIDEANAFAARVATEVGQEFASQVYRVFTLALNREPDSTELAECAAVVEQYGLSTLCRVVFNSNEFLFLP